jgi:hypothetical protein
MKPAGILGACVIMLLAVGCTGAAWPGWLISLWPADETWFEAQAWARAHTPPGTLFAPGRFGFNDVKTARLVDPGERSGDVGPVYHNGMAPHSGRTGNCAGCGALARSQNIEFLVLECRSMVFEPGLVLQYSNERFCIAEVDSLALRPGGTNAEWCSVKRFSLATCVLSPSGRGGRINA